MKTQQEEDENSEPVPLDMVIEILMKLPAKSLDEFRCVSKQWCSIISSRSFYDSFIHSFISRSLSRPHILLGYDIDRGSERRLFSIYLPHHPRDPNHSSFDNYYGVCNSVRDIICVSFGDRFVICNPTTRQFRTIPNDPPGFDHGDNRCVMWLGYDTSNDQYKIMRMVSCVKQVRSLEHSVCTLRLGEQISFSSWRRVESGIDYCFRNTKALCISGVVYYGARKSPSNSLVVIVSFDVASERLLFMEAPKENNLLGLINYQGKLGCFCDTSGNSYSLWILDDAKKQIWSKTYVFSPSFCDSYRKLSLRTCCATDAGEIIFESDIFLFWGHLFYYDLKKNSLSRRVKREDIVEDKELMHHRNIVMLRTSSGGEYYFFTI